MSGTQPTATGQSRTGEPATETRSPTCPGGTATPSTVAARARAWEDQVQPEGARRGCVKTGEERGNEGRAPQVGLMGPPRGQRDPAARRVQVGGAQGRQFAAQPRAWDWSDRRSQHSLSALQEFCVISARKSAELNAGRGKGPCLPGPRVGWERKKDRDVAAIRWGRQPGGGEAQRGHRFPALLWPSRGILALSPREVALSTWGPVSLVGPAPPP